MFAAPVDPDITNSLDEPVGTVVADIPEGTFNYSISSNTFGHYCVPEHMATRADSQTIAQADVPEAKTLGLIACKLGKGDLVSGCTGIGSFLPAFHEALSPHAMIHAYEPDSLAFAASSITGKLNGLDRLNLHQVILGKRVRDFPAKRLTDMATTDDMSDGPVEFVQMKKLDALVPQGRYVSVIHLNSHGLEMPAILGGKRVVQDSAPMIVMKATKTRSQRFFLSCLQAHFPDLGYQFAGVVEDNGIYLPLNRT